MHTRPRAPQGVQTSSGAQRDPLLLMRLSCSAPLGKGVPAPTGTPLALLHSLKRNTPHPPEIIRASED